MFQFYSSFNVYHVPLLHCLFFAEISIGIVRREMTEQTEGRKGDDGKEECQRAERKMSDREMLEASPLPSSRSLGTLNEPAS